MPEGVDFPPTTADLFAAHPELEDQFDAFESGSGSGVVFVYWEVYLENTGATHLGEIDLGGTSFSSGSDGEDRVVLTNTINYDLEIEANRDFDTYLFDVGESGYITEPPETTEFGETIVPLSDSQTGTVTIVDENGETTTDTHAFWSNVTGTEGDDAITVDAAAPYLNVFAGDGDDTIEAGTSFGFLSAGDGDDTIILSENFVGQAAGGDGDDIFLANLGAQGSELTGGQGADTFVLEAIEVSEAEEIRDYEITDFATGIDEIVVELGDDFDENWTIELETTATDNVIRVSFPDRVDEPDYEDLVVNIHGPRNLTLDDIVIMNSLPLTA